MIRQLRVGLPGSRGGCQRDDAGASAQRALLEPGMRNRRRRLRHAFPFASWTRAAMPDRYRLLVVIGARSGPQQGKALGLTLGLCPLTWCRGSVV